MTDPARGSQCEHLELLHHYENYSNYHGKLFASNIDNTTGRSVLGYELIQSPQSSCITPTIEYSIPISIGR